MSGPLEGIRIVDLTQVQAGPSCTQLFAFLGADVIKIEEPGVGDRTRREMSIKNDVDSFYFIVFNANKRSLTLNLKTEAGRAILLKIVQKSDIVVENYGPGQMERFGLTYDTLKTANPRIVYCRDQGFRLLRPQRPCQELRAYSPGDGRGDKCAGRSRSPAHIRQRRHRRLRHRAARRYRDARRAAAA